MLDAALKRPRAGAARHPLVSAAAMIARRLLALFTLAALAACGSDGVTSTSARAAKRAATSAKVTYTVYAWNTSVGDVVSRWKAGTLWSFAKALYVRDFMLGFTDADIAKYSKKNGTAEMNAMIAEGK